MRIQDGYMLFINATGQPLLRNELRHNRDFAFAVKRYFKLDSFMTTEFDPKDIGHYPEQDKIMIGGYERAIVIFSEKLVNRCLDHSLPHFVKDVWGFWPDAKILAVDVEHLRFSELDYAFFSNGSEISRGFETNPFTDHEFSNLFNEIVGCPIQNYEPDTSKMAHYQFKPKKRVVGDLTVNIGCLLVTFSWVALVSAAVAGIIKFIRTS